MKLDSFQYDFFGDVHNDPCKVVRSVNKSFLDYESENVLVCFYKAAYYIEYGEVSSGCELSHLCHRGPYCINVNHLREEDGRINKQRNKCKRRLKKTFFKERFSREKSFSKFRKIKIDDCSHDPVCFFNVSKS